jgi:pilus assembly protein Flp/PilA
MRTRIESWGASGTLRTAGRTFRTVRWHVTVCRERHAGAAQLHDPWRRRDGIAFAPSREHPSHQPGWPTAHRHGLRGSPRKEEGSMGRIRKLVSRLRDEDAGQGMAEYALLAGLIAVVAIGAVTLLGGNISTTLNNIATAIGGSGS